MGGTLTKLFDGRIGQRMKLNSHRKAVSKVGFDGHKPRSSRTRDRAGKKQALIVAALKLFASKGFDATTTREIAASAGCAEGLIHRYFNGKAGLLPALMEYRVSPASSRPDASRPLRAHFRGRIFAVGELGG